MADAPLSSFAGSSLPSTLSESGKRPSKRQQVAAACNECRLKKAKCDAARPTCRRCRARDLPCYYGVEPGTTRAIAHKRRHFELQDRHDGLLELYHYLRTRPEPEVAEIVRRIRQTEDPHAVVRLIQEGDILLQRRLFNPETDSLLKRFDDEALRDSTIKVRARPWTAVAGDGIVSHLISQYLDREQRFCMPFIHPELFLGDMAEGDPANAYFCSPLLVNAICAFGAFGSKHIRAIESATGMKMQEAFYNESKKLFDKEAGKASLTTTQALQFLYIYSTSAAMDRAGLVFRLAGCEMFKRLQLGSKIPPKPQKYNETLFNAAVSRNAWGLFLIESMAAFAYLQASLIAKPSIQEYFLHRSNSPDDPGSSLLGNDDVLDATSSGTAIIFRVMSRQTSSDVASGSNADIEERRQLYDLNSEWRLSLPSIRQYVPTEFRQWHYLRCSYHFGAIAVFRPLQEADVQIPGLGTPAAVCLAHCEALVQELDECRKISPSDFVQGSLETLYYYYVCSFTLIMMLNQDIRCKAPFLKCCQYFHGVAEFWPAANALLFGLQALAQQMDTKIPPEAMDFFPTTSAMAPLNNDLPISWAVPRHGDLLDLLSDDGADTGKMSIELGTIIAKWADYSI